MTISIDEVIDLMPEWREKDVSIEPLSGGITNRNFKILVNGSSFFVSISGRDSQLLGIDRHNKFSNAKICGKAGLSPQVVGHFLHQGVLVQKFLPFELCSVEALQSPAVQRRLVTTLKAMHNRASFWQDFDMFSLITSYLKIIVDRGLVLPKGAREHRERIGEIGKALAPYRGELVPCHNDLVPENLLDDGRRIFLIDFDYSGNNDPCFDLGSISVEAGYDDAQVRELARAYYDSINEKIIARIHLHGILGDVGWSLWSVIQAEISDLDFDFKAYGLARWNRAVEKMESRFFDKRLRDVSSKR